MFSWWIWVNKLCLAHGTSCCDLLDDALQEGREAALEVPLEEWVQLFQALVWGFC